ncbi:hypothetical protein ACFWP0_14465 [Achromobacter sp. NPDC058515]|uniref:DUF7661 family protein n=1 Tax=Achromobacter sp. NPDC058515 TaxID=3346533 RepID=UPI003655817F
MKFDIYGRFQLDIQRTAERWLVYRIASGKRVPAEDVVIPADVAAEDVAAYLDDLYHELSPPGGAVVPL